MTLMFQREVAERIVAGHGSKTYGRLSVLAQWRTEARLLFDIDQRAFTPPPKVTSSLVHFTPRSAPMACDPWLLERMTTAAFGQRRKMLRQSLKTLGVDAGRLLQRAGIDETERAEDVDVAGFVGLARALAEIVG
jgi:16S rRNA (adenine1518-N6/adenine1519-N6)-dimethyltransferase